MKQPLGSIIHRQRIFLFVILLVVLLLLWGFLSQSVMIHEEDEDDSAPRVNVSRNDEFHQLRAMVQSTSFKRLVHIQKRCSQLTYSGQVSKQYTLTTALVAFAPKLSSFMHSLRRLWIDWLDIVSDGR
jgi:Na+-transporting methylmalonyl-CoA/oxaloacetate decarboxylase gamma subunit